MAILKTAKNDMKISKISLNMFYQFQEIIQLVLCYNHVQNYVPYRIQSCSEVLAEMKELVDTIDEHISRWNYHCACVDMMLCTGKSSAILE